jgi:PAS domain S-box-containing protein
VFYSDRLIELLGYAPDEFSDTLDEFWSRLHPDDVQATRLAVDKHLEERVPYVVDYRLQTKTGEHRWFHARGQALWDEEGHATRMSGSLTDITERKRAEEERTKSEERFRNLMEQSPSPIEILNPEGKIEQVNSAWLRLWDLNEEEAAKALEKYNMLTDQQTVDLGVAPLIKKAFEGEPVILPPIQYSANRTAEEFGLPPMDLRVPWIQCHVYPVQDKQGKVDFVVNTYVDVTELRRVEREARDQRETLARVGRATSMGQLTGSIAHELNQPLTGILSNAQAAQLLLESGRLDDNELKAIVVEIISDTKRASDVIRNLREVFREQKGEFLPVDINAVADETTQLLHSELVIQQVALTTECASVIPKVDGNKVQLQQVLVNLIMNGIQAMSGRARDDRQLHIATAYDADGVKAWIEDNGPGIDPANIDSIFQPLATWKPGGTGMGLAISNSIIEAHGGRMWAENRPKGGARVGFSLPVRKGGQQA